MLFALTALMTSMQITLPAVDAAIETDQLAEVSDTPIVDYKMRPGSVHLPQWYRATRAETLSEIELAQIVQKLSTEIETCTDLRTNMEALIGDKPGSHNVHAEWVTRYQNCLKQRKTEAKTIGNLLDKKYQQIIADGGEEGATQFTSLIDKLRSRQAQLSRQISDEYKQQKNFVKYYMTGQKEY